MSMPVSNYNLCTALQSAGVTLHKCSETEDGWYGANRNNMIEWKEIDGLAKNVVVYPLDRANEDEQIKAIVALVSK